jgi:hypothetical protein
MQHLHRRPISVEVYPRHPNRCGSEIDGKHPMSVVHSPVDTESDPRSEIMAAR